MAERRLAIERVTNVVDGALERSCRVRRAIRFVAIALAVVAALATMAVLASDAPRWAELAVPLLGLATAALPAHAALMVGRAESQRAPARAELESLVADRRVVLGEAWARVEPDLRGLGEAGAIRRLVLTVRIVRAVVAVARDRTEHLATIATSLAAAARSAGASVVVVPVGLAVTLVVTLVGVVA